ncbi:MAG: PDZ domain-containing protein [Planctomycetota bacterium]
MTAGCSRPPAASPSDSSGGDAPAPAGLRLGPRVGPGAWIEADLRAAEAGEWTVYLAYASEADSLAVEGGGAQLSLVETRGGERRVLAEAARGKPDAGEGATSIWAGERDGVWRVWLGGRRAFSAKATEALGTGSAARAGFRAMTQGAELARLSVSMPGDPAFFDDFLRDGPDESWVALAGDWEYAGVRFPERSANPFSLRARFRGRERRDPFLERRTKPGSCGIGATLSSWRGAVDVERITGNGPAAEAGLQEHDIVLEIDGRSVRNVHKFAFYEDLEGIPGSTVTLKFLRRGELRPRTATLTRRYYLWARESHGLPLPREPSATSARRGAPPKTGSPAPPAEGVGRQSPGMREMSDRPRRTVFDRAALAAAGETSWDGYRYEASVMCPGAGGAGLAFAVRDARNFHLFRAVGDPGETGLAPSRLALVRVRDGQETVLAEREWGPRPQTYYRMAVDLDGDSIRCFVDGAPALEAADADLSAGRIGVWALEGEGAFFDDVAVSTDRASTAPAPDTRAVAVFAREQDMRRWADPVDEWVPDPASQWWWSRFRYPGNVTARIASVARFGLLDVSLRSPSGATPSGVVFRLDREKGMADLDVGSGSDGAHAAEAALEGDIEAVFAEADESSAAVRENGLEVASWRLRANLGDRVAIRGLENLETPGVVEVASDGVLDCLFRRAPVGWEVESGRWGVRNKWICDPRFSWYGGHSESLAAIWSKHTCGGDVTLDFYAALVMTMDDPPYERVGDFACTILADGSSLASGYTFIVSGGRNTWSRLYGGGRLLAESRAPADRLPSNVTDGPSRRDLHQRWFRITLERITQDGAKRVRALLDGREVFNVPDTLGREEGRCAIWTQDNGMLVARARVAASVVPRRPDELTSRAEIVSEKVGGLTNHAFGGLWTRLEEDGPGPSGAPAVRVANMKPGGAFAAASVRTCGGGDRVSFDFRADPGAEVDLYFVPIRARMDPAALPRVGPFRVRLTGPRGDRERHPVFAAPLAAADGGWHRVDVDLGRLVDAWSAAHEGPVRPILGRVRPVICNLEEGDGEDYLPAGLGGNAPGARYWVSGLRIEGAGKGDRSPPGVKRLLFPGEEGTRPGCVRVVFDDAPEKGGPAHLPAAARTRGSGVDTRSLIVSLRASPAAAVGPRPPPSVAGGPRLPPSVADGPAAWRRGHRAPAAGAPIYLRPGHPATDFDPLAQELEIDLAAAGVPSGPHAWLEVAVKRFADRAGNAGTPFSRRFTASGGADASGPEPGAASASDVDASGPALTEIAFEPAVPGEVYLDFEAGAATTVALRARSGPESPLVSLDPGTSPDGSTSLRLTAHEVASPFSFAVYQGFADLDRLLRFSFDYRLPEQTPVNLVVRGRRSYHSVVFTDRGDPVSDWSRGIRCAGEFGEAIADDTWRHAELDLAGVFRRSLPRLTSYPATGIFLADWGWRGLRPGDGYWIDNVRLEGARRGADLAVRWRAFDLSGVAAAAWALDSSPDTVPVPGKKGLRLRDAANARVALPEAAHLPDGPAWFQLRLRDGAGNWSRTFHRRVLLDNTPPVVTEADPADGATSAAKQITVRLADFSGVAMSSLRLSVAVAPPGSNGPSARRVYAVDGRACRFDRGGSTLRWSARGAGCERDFVPGARVTAEIIAASDLVGNALGAPVRWSWTYDPRADTEPPPAPRLRFTTGRPGIGYLGGPTFGDTNDFERELGPVEWTSGCEVRLSSDAARHGGGGARITVGPERRGEFVARLRERYWSPDGRPYLVFLCRLPEGLERLALRVDLLREKRDIVLAGPGAVAGLPPPDAEGWRSVAVDLGAAVRGWGVEFPEVDGEPYRLAGAIHLTGRAPPGSAIDIDDLELCASGWWGARVEIGIPEDASGIDGLAIAWDQAPDTLPPEGATHPLHPGFVARGTYPWTLPARGGQGPWHLHVRARDHAGNWGPAAHLRVDLLGR